MQQINLDVELREGKTGRGKLSALRDDKKIPAVIYGGKKPPLSVSVPEKELLRAAKQGGSNAILRLKHAQGEDTVILKEMSRHVVTQAPLHVDFQRVDLKQKLDVKVPLKVVGEAPGVKLDGGILEHILRELEIRCAAGNIPHEIAVDVSKLGLGKAIHVKELALPEGVELLQDPEQIVVNVVAPAAEEAPAAAAATPAAGAAEPEVIAKGKKPEEGEAAAAAPAKGEKAEKKEEKK